MSESTANQIPPGSREPEAQNDREWLHSLYEVNRDLVFRYAVSRVGREAALDVVSETFIAASRSRLAYDPKRGTEAVWLLGIATNQIRRWRRAESRHVSAVDRASDSGSEDGDLLSLPDRVDAERQANLVRRAIDALPEGERAAILLHAVEGLELKQVAEALSISGSAAKVRVFRARRRLRQTLSSLDEAKETR